MVIILNQFSFFTSTSDGQGGDCACPTGSYNKTANGYSIPWTVPGAQCVLCPAGTYSNTVAANGVNGDGIW